MFRGNYQAYLRQLNTPMYPQHLHELLSASLDYDAEVYRNYRCSHLSPRLAHNKPNSSDSFVVARLPDSIGNFVGS